MKLTYGASKEDVKASPPAREAWIETGLLGGVV